MGSHEARAAVAAHLHLSGGADHSIATNLFKGGDGEDDYASARFMPDGPASFIILSDDPYALAEALTEAGVNLFQVLDEREAWHDHERRSAIQDEADGVPDVGGMLSEALHDGESPASVA